MLRAAFIALSESRWLRAVAEHRRFGQRISARFVAGKEVADAIRATTAVNQFGASVSIDNLGENVTNAEEARASAQLYHHLLDEIAAAKLNALLRGRTRRPQGPWRWQVPRAWSGEPSWKGCLPTGRSRPFRSEERRVGKEC